MFSIIGTRVANNTIGSGEPTGIDEGSSQKQFISSLQRQIKEHTINLNQVQKFLSIIVANR